jgi:hypothetical protein
MSRTRWRCSEDISNDIFHQLTGADLLVGPLGGTVSTSYDNKGKFDWVHDWVEWIFIDHDNQPQQSTKSSQQQSNSRQIN